MTDQSEIVDLILAESDKRIGAQIQVMLAADTRLIGILTASSTLAAAGVATAASQFTPTGNATLIASALSFAAVAGSASIASMWALNPEPVDVPGWSPSLLEEDLKENKPLGTIKREMFAFNEEKLSNNAAKNLEIAFRVKVSVWLLGAAPIAAAVALVIPQLFHHCAR